jgi:ABC-2 type transport system ATP-binding protein
VNRFALPSQGRGSQQDATDSIIETAGLSKCYDRFAALDDCSFAVARGEILGLLGPNGAGKTTLLRLLLGLIKPTRGTARIDGLDCFRRGLAIRRFTSYLPGDVQLFRGMRGRDVLKFFARLRGQDGSRAVKLADELELDLATRVSTMSTGMRQKLALCIAFAAEGRLLILDEPTANLDPTTRAAVLELARQARQLGRTVMFSSHVLPEVEEVSDRVAILCRGRLVHVQNMLELRRRHRIHAELNGPPLPVPERLAGIVDFTSNDSHEVAIETDGELAPILSWLGTMPLKKVRIDPVGLRAIYDRYHGDKRRQVATVAKAVAP